MGNLFAICGVATRQTREEAFNSALHLNESLLQTLRGLGLDHKHLYALHQIFSAMDRDKSGEISMMEFFDYIDLKRSRFSEKAFSVMDRNGSGDVDFIEFVLAVWNYCSFNHASLVRFAFDLYDVDGSGEIEHSEVVRCVREVWGSAWEASSIAQKIVGKIDAIMEGTPNNRLSVRLFEEFAVRHPMLLFPAFELQMEIQRKVLGKKFWSRATEKRKSVSLSALNWEHVKEVTLISRQTSFNLLTSMEEDVERQLNVKTMKMTSSWRRRGSNMSSFSRSSLKRTFVASSSKGDLTTAVAAAAAAVEGNGTGSEHPRSGAPKSAGPRRQIDTGKRDRRQSAPAVPHVKDGLEMKGVKVASPKHRPSHEQILEDIE